MFAVSGITWIVTVAVSHAAGVALSHIVYVNVSSPTKSVFGVYSKVPSGLITNTPLDGFVFAVTVIGSPSGSKSLESTLPSIGVLISVTPVSAFAIGGSFLLVVGITST